MSFKEITPEEGKRLFGERLSTIMGELIKQFNQLDQGKSEFREIFGSTLWKVSRMRPEDMLNSIEIYKKVE